MFKIFFIIILFSNNIIAKNYYFIKHQDSNLHITAYLTGNYKLSELYIPDKAWGTDYSKQIANIRITEGNDINHDDTYTKIEYDLVNIEYSRYLKIYPESYNHYIEKNKFLLIGMGAFIKPHNISSDDEVIINISSNVKITSNVENQFFDVKLFKTTWQKLSDIILIGGAEVIKSDMINLVAFNIGEEFFNRISELSKKSLSKFNIFWKKQDISFNNKIIIIIGPPAKITKNAYVANVQSNTILAFINPSENEDIDLMNLFDHELHHFIFGCNAICGPTWFKEGFADYYMDKINAIEKGSLENFINKYNQTLSLYYKSPYSHLTDSEMDKLFFENKLIEKLPYKKGYLIAGQIDTITSLDKVINALIFDCKNKNKCIFNFDVLIDNIDKLNMADKLRLKRLIYEFEKLKTQDFLLFSPYS